MRGRHVRDVIGREAVLMRSRKIMQIHRCNSRKRREPTSPCAAQWDASVARSRPVCPAV